MSAHVEPHSGLVSLGSVQEAMRPLFDAIDSPDGEVPDFGGISAAAQRAHYFLFEQLPREGASFPAPEEGMELEEEGWFWRFAGGFMDRHPFWGSFFTVTAILSVALLVVGLAVVFGS